MKTLVTGATGTVGAHVLRSLGETGQQPRGFVRDPVKAARIHGTDVDLAIGAYGYPGSLRAAVDGVDQIFLTCANHPDQVAWETRVVDVAASAGIRRIVKLSALGADIGSPVAFFDAHARIERHLRSSEVPFVILQPAFSMSSLLSGANGVRQADAFFAPAAGAKIAMIDPRDVAAVAVAVLNGGDHDGQVYRLTGPDVVTFEDVVADLSAILDRRINFAAISDAEALAQFVAAGAPEWYVRSVVTQFGLLRQGAQAQEQDTVPMLTGHRARCLGDFLPDHAPAFS